MQDNNAQNSNATEQQNQAAAESYYRKGLNALLGIGRVKDYSVAFACFKEARTLGHTKATYQLGQMYLGKYTDFETNLGFAVVYLKEAADKGHDLAAYTLGSMYLSSRKEEVAAVEPYHAKVEQWLKLSAKHMVDAQYLLGEMYFFGTKDIQPNYEQAQMWFEDAARSKHRGAMLRLGDMYYLGGNGLAQDKHKALEYFQKAAEAGHREAQYRLGWLYYNDEIVPMDLSEARKWYQLAAEQGHLDAQKQLYRMNLAAEGLTPPEPHLRPMPWV